ncbi:MAG: Txe/YoeB family addiction module toxin [Betaproteobacteria bacterium]|nr:Txe/YoeB family addiction module toxin [Betaproteobacteria bacterium]
MTCELEFTEEAKKDYDRWKRLDRTVADKIRSLLADALEHPFSGLGKPEPLRFSLTGCWSRRITREHRLVYRVEGNRLIVISCRFHYDK